MMRLAVELHDTRIGTLEGDVRNFDFTPSAAGIACFGENSSVLSVAMPLLPTPRRDHAHRRRNWFSELLPEGDQLDYMLQHGGLRAGDTLGFLARYGRDVAGALQIWDLSDPTEPQTPALRPISISEVRGLLENPMSSPLANAPTVGKSSLGGVQPKIVLARHKSGWAQALSGYPTTHILKPQLTGDKTTIIFDEEYGSRISRRLGLARFHSWIEDFSGLHSLVIERYDRVGMERIHQEDLNQALGASGNQKYQEMGGLVSLKRVAETLKRHTPESDLVQLARMVILAVGIGNLDMHAKDIGLLHHTDGSVRLAPAYDVVPQAHLQSDGRMALSINRKYRHRELVRGDLVGELSSWGLRRAEGIINHTLEELKSILTEEDPLDRAFAHLNEQLQHFVRNLMEGKPAGSSRG